MLTFWDLNEAATEQQNYLRYMALGHKAYTLSEKEGNTVQEIEYGTEGDLIR